MTDGIKAVITGSIGILLGVVVTFLGVDNLNKIVIAKSVELGEVTSSLKMELEVQYKLNSELKDKLNKSIEDLEATESQASLLLASVNEQKDSLAEIELDISTILQSIGVLEKDEAKEKLEIVRQLVSELDSESGTTRFLELENTIKDQSSYPTVLSGKISMYAQNTRGIKDDTKCPEGEDAYRGIINDRIDFTTAFEAAPEVIVTLNDLSLSNTFRLTLEVISKDKNGFNFRFNTYCNTKVHGATASWMAVGT